MRWCVNLPDSWAIAGQWLYDWQTLIGAVLALLAAGWASWLLQGQIRQAETFNQDQINRSHNAARAILPLALSALSENCQKIADSVVQEIELINEGEKISDIEEVIDIPFHRESARLSPIEIDTEVYTAMQRFVETLTNSVDVRHVGELLSSVQILLARYRTFDLRQVLVQDALYGLLIDAAKVQLLVDSMYNYARFVDHKSFGIVTVTDHDQVWSEIAKKAHGLIFHWPQIDRISKPLGDKVDRYIETKASPWNEKFEAL